MKSYFFFLFPLALSALPQGVEIKAGRAEISHSAGTMRVEASDAAILEWDSFSIGDQETAAFFLPGSNSALLNRVVGSEFSSILGRLESNGQIFLINPNGILIGREGVIDAAGFIGSSLNLSNERFLAKGPLLFDGTETSVINEGTITASEGNVFLIGAELANRGTLQALKGMAALCEGDQVYIHLAPDEPIWFRIQSNEKGPLLNEGTVRASAIELHAGSIVHRGTLDATSAVERNGRVYLVADETLEFDGSALAPRGEARVLGNKVFLGPTAEIDVSGEINGGKVLIGGDFKGSNPEIPNADFTSIALGAAIRADATTQGDGGTIIAWGQNGLVAQGSLSAKGGPIAGDGGFIEVSSQGGMDFGWKADLSAVNGKAGTLLLDPIDVTIMGGGTTAGVTIANPTTYGPPAPGTVNINDAALSTFLNTMGSVTIQTSGPFVGGAVDPGSNGTIDVSGNVSWASTNTLTLTANQNIIVSGTLNNTGAGQMILTANTPTGNNYTGIYLVNATLSTAGGVISLTGTGGSSGTDNYGIRSDGSTISATGAGSITWVGLGGNSTDNNCGVIFLSSGGPKGTPTDITIVDGNVDIQGTGAGTGSSNIGIYSPNLTTITSNGSGQILLTGTGSPNGFMNNYGITDQGSGLQITSNSTGQIRLQGTGGGTDSGGEGILWTSMTIQSTLAGPTGGPIVLIGNGGMNSLNGSGIFITSSGGPFSSSGGNITLQGTGHSNPLGAGPGVQIIQKNITSVSGDIQMVGNGGGVGNANGSGVIIGNATITTGGNINVQGTGAGVDGVGVALGSLGGASLITTGLTSTITILGDGSPSAGSFSGGIQIGAAITSIDGNITLTGTGVGTTTGGGISALTTSVVSCTGSGSIFLNSMGFDIYLPSTSSLSTNTGTISLLALTGSSDILLGDCTSGSHFIAAANNTFTLDTGATLQLTNAIGNCTIIVDQQNPNGLGAGQFINNGTITTTSNNLAIYAVGGPTEPPPGTALPGPSPVQVTFGNLNPPIADWDLAIAPDFLTSKYYTSWDMGGPYHGAGFGAVYTPGTGVFGSHVVWYKFPFPLPPTPPPPPPGPPPPGPPPPGPSPIPPALVPTVITLVPLIFQQLWVNAQVNPEYFYYPYEFCRGFPCIWIADRYIWPTPCAE